MRLRLRLSLFYAAQFSVIGVQLPYWPLYLSAKGMGPPQIGQLMAATYFVKILTNPLVGHAADRRGERRRPIILLAALALLATFFYMPAESFPALLAVGLLSQAAFTAMMPLGDNLTMLCTGLHKLDYGRVRLWGSLSFIAVASLGGPLLVDAPRWMILATCLAGIALTLGAGWTLPDIRGERADLKGQPMAGLVKDRRFLLFLLTTSLTQVSHMIYYGFATLHWRAAGLSGAVIGGLWAEGVIAEVALFAFGARLVAHFGPARLLTAAGLAGVIRWSVLAVTTDPLLLASVQFLHALTYAAGHLGAMHFIHREVPPGLSARAQGIYSSVTMGIVPGLALLFAGALYQDLGGLAFLTMSLCSGLGLIASLQLGGKNKSKED